MSSPHHRGAGAAVIAATPGVVDVSRPLPPTRWTSVLSAPFELLAVVASVPLAIAAVMIPVGLVIAAGLWVVQQIVGQF